MIGNSWGIELVPRMFGMGFWAQFELVIVMGVDAFMKGGLLKDL